MGKALPARRLSDAPSRRPAGRLAARPALSGFRADSSGATAIEYAVLIACLGMAIVTAVSTLQTSIFGVLNTAATAILTAIS
jgi:Flp pilus assembly pilin Flp